MRGARWILAPVDFVPTLYGRPSILGSSLPDIAPNGSLIKTRSCSDRTLPSINVDNNHPPCQKERNPRSKRLPPTRSPRKERRAPTSSRLTDLCAPKDSTLKDQEPAINPGYLFCAKTKIASQKARSTRFFRGERREECSRTSEDA